MWGAGVYKITLWRVIILIKNSPFESILEKKIPLRAYFMKQKIFCLGMFVEIFDITNLVEDNDFFLIYI